jgi:hypothetical protein
MSDIPAKKAGAIQMSHRKQNDDFLDNVSNDFE